MENLKFKRFFKQLVLKSKLKEEIEWYPSIGIKYFEIKEHFEKIRN